MQRSIYRLLQSEWERACLLMCGVSLEEHPHSLQKHRQQWALGGTWGQGLEEDTLLFYSFRWLDFFLTIYIFKVFKSE